LSAQVLKTIGFQCNDKRILVVEDNEINQQIMLELLTPLALTVANCLERPTSPEGIKLATI